MSKLKEFKQELKKLAVNIRKCKSVYKEYQRGNITYDKYYEFFTKLNRPDSYRYRHMHIAYCLLRKRKYEEIENKVKANNEPNWTIIYKFMESYRNIDTISCGDTVLEVTK